MLPYRVEVSHSDPEHYNTEPAHYGPAFDDNYINMVADFTGGAAPTPLAAAQLFADRFLQENTHEGWTARIVELEVDNPEAPEEEQTASWKEVVA